MSLPRVLFAGVQSGCGKTTVTCAVMQALVNRGLKLHAFKCGPDYVDPLFHQRAMGTKGSNLDLFFYDENTLLSLLNHHGKQADLSILEGVMGYYDGWSFENDEKSSHHIARLTQTPAVLVVNARGMAYSLIALLKGFVEAMPDSCIQGVILNQVTQGSYERMKASIEQHFGARLRVLGYLPSLPEAVFESRQLGLVTPDDIQDVQQKLQLLARQAQNSIDLDGLLQLARTAPALKGHALPFVDAMPPVRIAVAWDSAFCFYYQDNLDVLKSMGAQLIPFSPLSDQRLPECDALYLGGGYPELHAQTLSNNQSLRKNIKQALQAGLPCIAECGGFMYLTAAIDNHPMVGFLPGECRNTGKLQRFGYITLTAAQDNMLCKQGQSIRAHEFHYYDCTDNGHGFVAEKPSGRSWPCVHSTDRLYAGFPHLPFYANLDFAVNFYQQALNYQQEKER
ncbi:MAG: cobyrinate a,c-diamide synthase [Clostridiales bacterium]|nr:cobyrinate a,c-diamide synthase [Clostridiales bacterium]